MGQQAKIIDLKDRQSSLLAENSNDPVERFKRWWDRLEDPHIKKAIRAIVKVDRERWRAHAEDARHVLSYLNDKRCELGGAGRFQPTETNLRRIGVVLAGGATVVDCRAVIRVKAEHVRQGTFELRYLTTETLFRPAKFETYLVQAADLAAERRR